MDSKINVNIFLNDVVLNQNVILSQNVDFTDRIVWGHCGGIEDFSLIWFVCQFVIVSSICDFVNLCISVAIWSAI
jgi:hypothetical protein